MGVTRSTYGSLEMNTKYQQESLTGGTPWRPRRRRQDNTKLNFKANKRCGHGLDSSGSEYYSVTALLLLIRYCTAVSERPLPSRGLWSLQLPLYNMVHSGILYGSSEDCLQFKRILKTVLKP
jgi:hypothetical protein